jgi:hypothetical protein
MCEIYQMIEITEFLSFDFLFKNSNNFFNINNH